MNIRSALAATATPLLALPEAGGWQRCHSLPPHSAVFDGHFPERPILPAVVQCLMAQMLIEDALGQALRLVAIVQAKFTRLTGPDEIIVVSARPARTAGQWDCTLQVGAESVAQLRLSLCPALPPSLCPAHEGRP